MELMRSQDKDLGMPNTSGYHPPNREPSSKISSPPLASTAGEKRRDQTAHGNTIFNPPQTLDHYHLYQHPQQFNPALQQTNKPRRRDPDPVPASIALSADATSTPIAVRSNSKSPPPPLTTTNAASSVRYRECLKNHAASMGGHVIDGCGEFMPSGEDGTLEALKCAACECHRNFHRKEIDGETKHAVNSYYANNSNKNKSRRDTIDLPPQHPHLPPQLPLQQHQRFSHGLSTGPSMGQISQMIIAFRGSGRAPAEISSEDLDVFQSIAGAKTSVQPPLSKKRFRTKFTQEQKEKMMEFAEKLRWKIQKQDEQEVQQFCAEVGVKRQVFKVWMHNNQQAMKKEM